MINLDSGTTWSLALKIATPILLVLIVGCTVAGVISLRRWWKPDRELAVFFGIIPLALAGILLIGGLVGFYPYSAQYHQWQPVVGAVTQVDSRLLGGDDSTTQRFVVTFASGQQRSCDDTRCSQVRVGDTLGLSCKRHWQYTGTDGWDCNYVGVSKGR